MSLQTKQAFRYPIGFLYIEEQTYPKIRALKIRDNRKMNLSYPS